MGSVGKHYRQLRNWGAPVVAAMPLANLHANIGNLLHDGAGLIIFPLDSDGSTDDGGGRGSRNTLFVHAPLISAA